MPFSSIVHRGEESTVIKERSTGILKKNKETDAAPKKKGALRENIEAIIVAVLLALFIRTFVVQAFKIPSGSMKETLQIGDHILVNKFIYGVKIPIARTTLIPIKKPQRDDIVVFKYPENPKLDFIKRVVGVEGDVIEIRDKRLYVNHEPYDRSYAVFKDSYVIPGGFNKRDNFGPITVAKDSLFVMGDNRDNSKDSRFWGQVPERNIVGKAFAIWMHWETITSLPGFSRVGWII